jgi:hypothetical protein
MALLKELHTSTVTEALGSAQRASMQTMLDLLDTNATKLGNQLKVDSQFAKRLEKSGGDMVHFKSIVKSYDKLYQDILDLVQYTVGQMDGDQE